MKRSKLILFFFISIAGNILFGQNTFFKRFDLKWKEKATFTINATNKIQMDLLENNQVNNNLLPVFIEKWEVANNQKILNFKITNVVFEQAFIPDSDFVNSDLIPLKLAPQFHFVNERTHTFAIIDFVPLIKEGNIFKKVVSFELEYSSEIINFAQKNTSQIKNSVLSTGTWYKFQIDTTGVFKIDKSFLEKLGLNTNEINPKNIQIFGNGGEMLPFKNSEFRYDGLQENAIYISGEADNKFDADDYILFYGKGPHGWNIKSNPSIENISHANNIFSDASYYFLTVGNSLGKRISEQTNITSSASHFLSSFHDFTFFEEDLVNLYGTGQQWFGDDLSINNTKLYSIPFNEIEATSKVYVKVRGVVESSLPSSMAVKVNNQNLFNLNFPANGGLTRAIAVENKGNLITEGNNINVEINFNNGGNPSSKAFLDYIEVIGEKKLVASGKQFSFRNFDILNLNGTVEYAIKNASKIDLIWNVSNPLNPTNVKNQSTNSDFKFNVSGGKLEEFIAINYSDLYRPKLTENNKVENQNLHSLSNIDYIIITQDFLVEQAERLANFHRLNSNLKVEVIKLNQIYNEFASGSPDITAIRDFVKHLYDNSSSNKVKYVCLFGDATYDYKNRINNNNNIVPVFEAFDSFNLATSYVTDDYYGMMDANEGSLLSFERQDVATGRIPVSEVLQAEKIVDKILNYYNKNSFGNWRTSITLIADDIDAIGEEVLQEQMEEIADTIFKGKPQFNLKKIYLDAYTQESTSGGKKYPTAKLDILNQVESGTLLVDYFGHGGEGGWSSEGILGVSDIQNFNNKFKLPLFVTVTCEFTRFDNPIRKTAGEFLFWNEKGGASTLISTTREIFISVGQSLNERLIKPLLNFNNENYTISEALMYTKNQFSTTQRFFIFNIGDPAMHLSVPKPNIRLTKMNNKPITQSLDTIKALSYVKFEGEITDLSENIITDFNGEIDITVYDKPINKTTLDNDNKNKKMQFDVIESKIFTGRSKVENGNFTFDFITPKDIKIAYGKGKLSFYANNTITDKLGYNSNITIGGINSNAPEDTTGPNVQLYLNDLNFVEGGNTNESPLFIAVIEDESGINTSITAVDHDIVAILDGNQSNPIILNDYYQTELNNYKKGRIEYPLRNLDPGIHTITLKVWDTYNNLSETSFSFIVVNDSDLVLTNVLNYPNPFINYTEFWFNHNKPNELLNVQIQIFTVSGKLVKTINQTVQSEGTLCKSIVWNGLDDFGSKIGKGVYVYKLKVKSINSNTSSEKIEKLVILQ
ncbi:type IX secretion system sortase PorU [Lutibacter maritimus]|uniref:Peptidase family C25 n=1 Tax=Lutibacter maritimus TaxID=593133 RepID=A0A1I6S4W7_9FLAO|nr:type IX secretion system sortase PorU [Lutibacter maritimus]SFS71808.1 Peptidase family C25 [Lutibacter maritimus]